jgi:hypothetical protein
VDIGREKERIRVEPIEDPFERREPEPEPSSVPEVEPAREPATIDAP